MTGGEIGMAASRAHAHWVDPDPTQFLHGSGYVGASTPAGIITVLSVVRGPWEVRSAYLDDVSPEAEQLVFGGWALSGSTTDDFTFDAGTRHHVTEPLLDNPHGIATVRTPRLVSSMAANSCMGNVTLIDDASPLGISAIPHLSFPVRTREWVSALITLSGQVSPEKFGENNRIAADISSSESGLNAHIVWPDGVETRTTLLLGNTETVPSGTSLEGEKE